MNQGWRADAIPKPQETVMKLYYSPGACSLAPHIVAREAGINLDLVKVDLAKHALPDGSDYYAVNPRGYVPMLQFDDGAQMTESQILVQVLADRAPGSGLLPQAGSMQRYRVQEWLATIATELHKNFSWLWGRDTAEATKEAVKAKLAKRFAEIDGVLAGRPYLAGAEFTIADAYGFTIINWANFLKVDLKAYPNLMAWMGRIAARPKVQEALKAEGLLN
jgi:glutathione S-transferase